MGVIAFAIGRRRCAHPRFEGRPFHSTQAYYGWYAALWTVLPAVGIYFTAYILFLCRVYAVSAATLIPAATAASALGLFRAYVGIRPELRARNAVEQTIMAGLLIASFVSILTTLGIVVSVVFEAMTFFKQVPFFEFLTGTKWNPDTAFLIGAGREGEQALKPQFGSVPLFAGTFMITLIAMCVSIPIGLFSAIFMSEYASPGLRRVAKPVLEILAGIPTVVYGFFAAITVSPLIVAWAEKLGFQADSTNALSPGLVMGIMIIPFVSSLSDDVITAVPNSMREGAFALGATKSETIKKVLLPAALPGIVSAFLLAVSRAVGETMIVVMAAGLRANLTANPLEGMTTVTVRIVDALTGDQAFDSLETLSAFALGFVLLLVTLVLNIISAVVIRKFHEKYE